MDGSQLLQSLNEKQREAVDAAAGHVIVLAGAGSGKTRVLVHRIAWLLQAEGVSSQGILAVTFTNKAAQEMRHRIESLLGFSTQSMWIGTFHSLCHRFLRSHWRDAALIEHFQILDSEDQYRLIRRILKSMNLDEDQWQPKQIQSFINSKKDEGLRPHQIEHQGDFYSQTLIEIYRYYQQICEQTGAVDFAELLLRTHELWQKHAYLLEHYQRRFRYILVDEFQDTNAIQYNWLKLLVGQNNFLTIVGDDDQSIYGWRGARIENLHKALQDFPNNRIIRLEQNYRSTGTILKAANALIENNQGRLGKNLWTKDGLGEPIKLYAAFNEIDEARYIVENIKKSLIETYRRNEIAILYRSNAQSRVLEEALIYASIPYRVYGGLRFYERAEIKDALAYLRLIANHNDDIAFERIVNTPPRGIGNTTLTKLREISKTQNISLWQAARNALQTEVLANRAEQTVNAFLRLIEQLSEKIQELELSELTEYVIQTSGLLGHYHKEKGEKAQARIENLEELISATRAFKPEDLNMPLLETFLSHAALEAGDTQAEAYEECVQLMTLHSAKGLEFPCVYISGMEEGLFPHQMSLEDPGRLEEERRLCYVGITRAMRKLNITYAEVRRMHGSENYHRPSRFIQEIPAELIEEIRIKANISRPFTASSNSYQKEFNRPLSGLPIGTRVSHQKFGEGVVLAYEGQGEHARVQVNFKSVGSKWLLASFVDIPF